MTDDDELSISSSLVSPVGLLVSSALNTDRSPCSVSNLHISVILWYVELKCSCQEVRGKKSLLAAEQTTVRDMKRMVIGQLADRPTRQLHTKLTPTTFFHFRTHCSHNDSHYARVLNHASSSDFFYERFMSCYVLFTVYYDVLTVILYDLLRVVTDNYEQLTNILRAFYGLLRVYYGKLRFIEAFTC